MTNSSASDTAHLLNFILSNKKSMLQVQDTQLRAKSQVLSSNAASMQALVNGQPVWLGACCYAQARWIETRSRYSGMTFRSTHEKRYYMIEIILDFLYKDI
jgi:hypothetical protein